MIVIVSDDLERMRNAGRLWRRLQDLRALRIVRAIAGPDCSVIVRPPAVGKASAPVLAPTLRRLTP